MTVHNIFVILLTIILQQIIVHVFNNPSDLISFQELYQNIIPSFETEIAKHLDLAM